MEGWRDGWRDGGMDGGREIESIYFLDIGGRISS